MKYFAVLALLVAAVAADSYVIKQPKYPCAFELELTQKEGKDESELLKYYVNGRFVRYKLKNDDVGKLEALLRPDITKEVFKVDCIAMASKISSSGDKSICSVDYIPLSTVIGHTTDTIEDILGDVVKIKFKNKEKAKYDGKKCDVYYNDKIDDGAVYVYDDYVYCIHYKQDGVDYDMVFDYTWRAPMKKFVWDEDEYGDCVKELNALADTPSDDFVFCAASGLKVAFVALLVALVSALF